MLEVCGKEATNIQYSLFLIFMDACEILDCVKQYIFLCSYSWKEIDELDIYDKYPKLLSVTLSALRYEIIIGVGKIIDDDLRSINLEKLFNQCEQYKKGDFRILIKKYKNERNEFKNLENFIKIARDKIYAHIDLSFNTKKVDKFSEFFLESNHLQE